MSPSLRTGFLRLPRNAWQRFCQQFRVVCELAGARRRLAARQHSEYFHNALYAIPDLVWLKDVSGVYLACNASFEQFFGAPEERIVGRRDEDFVSQDQAASFRERDCQAMAAGKPVVNDERVTFASDGRSRWLETVKTPIHDAGGNLVGVLGIARDITERKRIEETLHKSEENYRDLTEKAPIGVFQRKLGGEYLYFNAYLVNLFECESREEFVANYSTTQSRWEDPLALAEFNARLEQDNVVRDFPVKTRLANGRVKWFSLSASLDRRNELINGFTHDITQRKRAEEALAIANEFNATVVRSSPAFFVAIDADGKVMMMNEAMLRAVGFEEQEVIGCDYAHTFLLPDEWDAMASVFHALVVERTPTINTNRVKTRSGSTLTVEWRGAPISHGNHFEYFIGVGVDITERLRAEQELGRYRTHLEELVAKRTMALQDLNAELQQTLSTLTQTQKSLVRSEKLAALGSLVAGVAHELNTPIGNGLTAASTIEEKTLQFLERTDRGITRSALADYLNTTVQASRLVCTNLARAAELIDRFKQVAVAESDSQRRRFELRRMLQRTVLTLSPSLKKTPHELKFEVDDGIRMDSFPGPLGQAISNLFTNALLHAFEGRDHGTITLKAHQQGPSAVIEFSDDGIGIPSDKLQRIFDPFYTTKLGRGGRGLGLHIVHNIVTSLLGGDITVESAQGHGCCFRIIVPLKAPALKSAADNGSLED